MERLTTHDPNRQILVCSANYKSWNEIYDRLAAYEDTGLSPEEIKELCTDEVAEIARMFRKMIHSGEIDHLIDLLKAEQEGRLVVLPCKVGDTVWFNTYKNNATECVGIQPHEVKRVNVHFLTDGAEIPQWEFGKTVFLTRAEAEAALKGVSEDA